MNLWVGFHQMYLSNCYGQLEWLFSMGGSSIWYLPKFVLRVCHKDFLFYHFLVLMHHFAHLGVTAATGYLYFYLT